MHAEDKYEACNKARFHTSKGKIKPVRPLFYLGLKYVLANKTDPKWAAAWKRDMDMSINDVQQSEHVALMDNQYLGVILHPDAGLFYASTTVSLLAPAEQTA